MQNIIVKGKNTTYTAVKKLREIYTFDAHFACYLCQNDRKEYRLMHLLKKAEVELVGDYSEIRKRCLDAWSEDDDEGYRSWIPLVEETINVGMLDDKDYVILILKLDVEDIGRLVFLDEILERGSLDFPTVVWLMRETARCQVVLSDMDRDARVDPNYLLIDPEGKRLVVLVTEDGASCAAAWRKLCNEVFSYERYCGSVEDGNAVQRVRWCLVQVGTRQKTVYEAYQLLDEIVKELNVKDWPFALQ